MQRRASRLVKCNLSNSSGFYKWLCNMSMHAHFYIKHIYRLLLLTMPFCLQTWSKTPSPLIRKPRSCKICFIFGSVCDGVSLYLVSRRLGSRRLGSRLLVSRCWVSCRLVVSRHLVSRCLSACCLVLRGLVSRCLVSWPRASCRDACVYRSTFQ